MITAVWQERPEFVLRGSEMNAWVWNSRTGTARTGLEQRSEQRYGTAGQDRTAAEGIGNDKRD